MNLRQTRGEFGDLIFKTESDYHTLFAQDAWSPNKYVTINAGLRWEQQHVAGVDNGYTFVDNWSPRIGVSVDPWGNRKTKVTANFGRYTESLPLDIAIRSLSSEIDFADSNWVPPTDGAGHVLVNSDGTLDLTNLHGTTNSTAGGGFIRSFNSGAAVNAGEGFGPQTRSEYLDEYQVGFEHEFGNSGVIFTAHYTDRRIRRIIEDNAELSPEAAQGGTLGCFLGGACSTFSQFYQISNVNKAQDIFKNPSQVDYFATNLANPSVGAPGTCVSSGSNQTLYSIPTDSNGNSLLVNGNNAMCIANCFECRWQLNSRTSLARRNSGRIRRSGPHLRAMEFEVNKSFSRGWQMRANYRIAKLFGNYEGSFRNDNAQNDPNISSLFDFTRGDFNLLGPAVHTGRVEPGRSSPGEWFRELHLYTTTRRVSPWAPRCTSRPVSRSITCSRTRSTTTLARSRSVRTTPSTALRPVVLWAAPRTMARSTTTWTILSGSRKGRGSVWRLTCSTSPTAKRSSAWISSRSARSAFRMPTLASRPESGPSAVNGNTNPGYLRPFYARLSVKFEF